jgi:hypothetical protein
MTNIKGDYWQFYLMGRDISRLPEGPDFEEGGCLETLAKEGGSFLDTVRQACEDAVKSWSTDRRRNTWQKDNADEIDQCGGDKEAAYHAWLGGIIDVLVLKHEEEALGILEGILDEDDEDEDEERSAEDDD